MLTPAQAPEDNIPSPTFRPIKHLPSRKRRKLSDGLGAAVVMPGSGRACPYGSSAGGGPILGQGQTCVSCHRAFDSLKVFSTQKDNPPNSTSSAYSNVTITNIMNALKDSSAAICSLCDSLTCHICARHCTSANTPRPPPDKCTSRLTLEAASTHTNSGNPTAPSGHVNISTVTARRRKDRDDFTESEDLEQSGNAGCGRTLCRGCCVENEATQTYTCIECVRAQQLTV